MRQELDPDPDWVAGLSGKDRGEAVRSLEEAASEHRLFHHLKREHDREGRESYIEIDAPLELHALVRLLRPKHVVEVGVSSGVSSAYLLNALSKNGRGTLHSVDLPSVPGPSNRRGTPPRASWSLPSGRTSGWAIPPRLRRRWDLRLGDKASVLPLLARELPRVDLVVYDVPHEDRSTGREFRTLDPLLSEGGVVIVDHGPNGGLCSALRLWSGDRGTRPIRRQGLGLFGMKAGRYRRSTLQRQPPSSA